ncbi:hypothetical protein GNX71_03855 [Variovorax sp. RKNM96]|uniref:DUF7024 domain-containing protein n=1 Tax=Variovorax sp. RKNM96 TaxID=2681552 RepID=UPI001980A484|nr:hypothetical protein [Variovorax sp. RKNM96]QSI28758.1 hypothetical protein GNX71_03855 [Variovorax sp. RKNM96]
MILKIRGDRMHAAGITMLVAIVAMVFVYRRGQDLNWDLLNYHFYSGFFVLHGRFEEDLAAAGLQTFFHPAVNLLAYLALKFLGFPWSAWAILFVQLLAVPPFLLICRKIARDLGYQKIGITELFVVALGLMAPLWWSELGTTFFSSTTAPFILWAIYFGIKGAKEEAPSGAMIFVSGGLLGLASGLKLTNAPFAVGFFIALFVAHFSNGLRSAAKSGFIYSAGAVVGFTCTAWWYVLLYQRWGSPVFPLYNAIFKSPYFEAVSFRDMRWYFSSLTEFATYVFQSASLTGKTSEIPFADARLIVVLALGAALVAMRRKLKLERSSLVVVVFFVVSYMLWATAFAYQRYLIPIEFLFGVIIWIFVSRLFEKKRAIMGAVLAITLVCGVMIKVPDWGHTKKSITSSNPFGLELPKTLEETPAIYLVQGVPNSYIFPFLSTGSKFYRVDFSSKFDSIVRQRVVQRGELPVRVLTNHASAEGIRNTFEVFAGMSKDQELKCWSFKSSVDGYVACEPGAEATVDRNTKTSTVNVTLGKDMPWEGAVRGLTGFSPPESWGRWTEADEASIELNRCLPTGRLKISMLANAYGPNVDRPVRVIVGSGTAAASFGHAASEVAVELENEVPCESRVRIVIPQKTSPFELGEGPDKRELGIGLRSLRIEGRPR